MTPDRVAPTLSGWPSSCRSSSDEGVAARELRIAVEAEAVVHGLETQVAHVDPRAPQEGVTRIVALLRNEGVGLVVALGRGPDAQAIAKVVRGLPEARFLFVDTS